MIQPFVQLPYAMALSMQVVTHEGISQVLVSFPAKLFKLRSLSTLILGSMISFCVGSRPFSVSHWLMAQELPIAAWNECFYLPEHCAL